MADDRGPGYRRSTKCEGGTCVEVGEAADGVRVRRSDLPQVELVVPRDVYTRWLEAVKRGEFDSGTATGPV